MIFWFYASFWDHLSPFFGKSLHHSLNSGMMSVDQRWGVITLKPKKGTDRRFLRNRCPITLLNTDFNSFTKAVATRLQTSIPQIIHSDQTGFIRKRDIGSRLQTTQDVIEVARENDGQAFLLALDYKKAFDMVNWELLFKALQFFNFGSIFIHSICFSMALKLVSSIQASPHLTSRLPMVSSRGVVTPRCYLLLP